MRLLGTLGAVREFGAKNQVSFIFAKVGLALHQMTRRRGKHCVVVTPHHPPCSCFVLGTLQPQEALNSEGQYLHEAFKDVAKELQANHVSTVSLLQGRGAWSHQHIHTL